jgi:uncharacterized protein
MKDYITTRSGRVIQVLHPKPGDFDIDDIAWSLAHINRFAGSRGVYSVAQHSYHVAEQVMLKGGNVVTQLAGLLHDAGEMVTGDVPSPVKRHCIYLKAIERGVVDAVMCRFGLHRGVDWNLIHKCDVIVRALEVGTLVPCEQWPLFTDVYDEIRPWEIAPMGPHQAKQLFLRHYRTLEAQRAEEKA